ncbi:MAG: nucleoside-diphosphate sugar epimerase [Candidatus Lindowbacteria bacterium RIFCSPLOWO2_02_FULL_62_12]|nr:MAG: nucleoside-diphosphate sugar epimerase [Candidatus Lindowbacteria bacterium RIFCSPLOWO2_02_FULL_62_12]
MVALDNLSTGRMENIEHLKRQRGFKFAFGSVLDTETIRRWVRWADQIYHLAAAVGVKFIIDHPLDSIMVNVRGTENVLEAANFGKKKTFIASTSEIYGKSPKFPYREGDDRTLGSTHTSRWSYSDTKALDEFLSFAYYREKRLPVVVGRLFNTCGPRQTGDYGMVLPRFVKSALLGHPITIYGDGKQTRCFTYVDDAVEAMMRLMASSKAVGDMFNIGHHERVTINDLARRIKAVTRSKSEISHIPYEKAYEKGFEDMRHRVPDLSKIKKFVGWAPKIKLDEIIRRVVEYHEQ